MNIKDLAKDVKEIMERNSVVVYKIGKQWHYETLFFEKHDTYSTNEKYIKAYEIDNRAIIVDPVVLTFEDDTLKYISDKIKDSYLNGIGNYNLNFNIRKLEKDKPVNILIYYSEKDSASICVLDYKFKEKNYRDFTFHNEFYNHSNELVAIEDNDTFIRESEAYFMSFEDGIITFENSEDGSIIKGFVDEKNLCFKVEYVE